MRSAHWVLGLALVSGCIFRDSSTSDGPKPGPGNDGPGSDGAGGGVIDAASGQPPDAVDPASCPAPPPQCTVFTCAGSTSCYYRCQSKRAFAGAQTQCLQIREGNSLACLATISNATEQQCIAQAVAPGLPDFVWAGYSQVSGAGTPSGSWSWSCGSSLYVHPSWAQGGEPNDLDGIENGQENCLGLAGLGAWIDVDCGVEARYVCELP